MKGKLTMNFTMNDQQAAAKLAYDLSTADDVAHCSSFTSDAFLYIDNVFVKQETADKYRDAALGLIKYASRHLCVSLSKILSDISEANKSERKQEEYELIFTSELNGHYEG
jgi:hypothetical protein